MGILLEQTLKRITPPDPRVSHIVRQNLTAIVPEQRSLGRLDEMLRKYASIRGTSVPDAPALYGGRLRGSRRGP